MNSKRVIKGIAERRLFVKHAAEDFVPDVAEVNPKGNSNGTRSATVIIPTRDAYRDGYFPVLLTDIKRQSLKDFQVIIVKGDKRQGRAINTAVALSKGEIIIILDDDVRLGHKDVLRNLVKAVWSDEMIGMAGVANLVPQDAPWLVRRVMKEVPRRSSSLVSDIIDSDLAEHPCCAIRRRIFKEIGGENELIPRGLDPYLRAELRERGYKVVVIPETWIYHFPPEKMISLIKQFFRNGMCSAYCTKFYPQWSIELAEMHGEEFKERVSRTYRLWRYVKNLIKSFLTLKWIYLLILLCSLAGFSYGYTFLRKEEA